MIITKLKLFCINIPCPRVCVAAYLPGAYDYCTGDVRARVGVGFLKASSEFARAGCLEQIKVPFGVWHAKADTFGECLVSVW